MLKKILISIFIIFNVLAILYLISPTPKLPDLSNSVKSDLPGDTIQIPNVSGYFTNMTRTEVMNFYKSYYYGLFKINLNHPPEKAKEIIVDTIPSYYFEEFILPFKESLYVNGFEWENDVFTKPENRAKNKLIYQNKEYKAKITIRTFPTSIPYRFFSFFFTETSIIVIFYLLKSTFKK
ncbi:MAG: hypothetical protein PHX34_02255 [Candidatus Shapirobacteria bacterium]|nr:hypothetical protein [Candidatus Shapirobacteria bacterium]